MSEPKREAPTVATALDTVANNYANLRLLADARGLKWQEVVLVGNELYTEWISQ